MRALRELKPGATYYVSSTVNRDRMDIRPAQFKILFLTIVLKAKKKFDFELWDFTVQGDCFHFLIKPGEGTDLSKLMQWLKCNFTKAWNKEVGLRRGHLWGERFYSHIIEDQEDFDKMSEFINEYAVRAGLVEKAKDWKFGGAYDRATGLIGLIDELLEWDLIFFPRLKPAAALA
jgi:REP element-mobilizing transposase RayT